MEMSLGEIAMKAAADSAVRWLSIHNKKPVSDDAFLECLKANVKIRLPKALKDVKDALDANMGMVAEQTFLAEMRLAGIDAAKECFA